MTIARGQRCSPLVDRDSACVWFPSDSQVNFPWDKWARASERFELRGLQLQQGEGAKDEEEAQETMVADTEEGAAPPETETETETRDEGSATPPLPEAPTEAPPKEGAGGPHQGNRTKGEARATKGDTGRKEGAKGKAGEVQGEIELAPVAEPEALPEPFSMDKEGAAGPSASLPDVPAWDEDENDDGGWGAWGNFGQNLAAAGFGLGAKLQEGLQEAAETAASLKDTLQEAVNETVAQDDKIGESSASKPNLEADSFEARRAQFLDNVEDQTASTDVVKNLDDHISYFATGAASLFGSVLGNAQKIATSAATDIQESFSQGVTDVAELTKKSGAVKVASTGLKLAADHTVKLAEMSLEKAGSTAKGILDMAEVVAGLDGPGPKDGARAGEEEDLSFSRAWFIYGGPDAAEDMDHMSVKSNAISNGIKVKLSGDLLSEYEGLVKMLGAKFDLSTAEVGDYPSILLNSSHGSAVDSLSSLSLFTDPSVSALCAGRRGRSRASGIV